MATLIIDNGHGVNTPGKRSPIDKLGRQILEYKYARELAGKIEEAVSVKGLKCVLLVPEEMDIPLTTRCKRANEIYSRDPDSVLISIHLNAAGNGCWTNARGWEAYTSPGNTKSDRLATLLYKEAESLKANNCTTSIRMDYSDGDPDKEARFTILTKTKCPAVLTENLFMDGREDFFSLLSTKTQECLVSLHVNAILKYFGMAV